MLVSYNLTMSDFLAAQHLHYWRTFSKKITLILMYGIFPLLGVFSLFLYGVDHIFGKGKGLSPFFLLYAIILCLIPIWFQFNLRRCYKRSRVSDENCNLDLTDENIRTEMPGYAKSTVEWQAIRNYIEGKKSVLIYMAPTRFFVIPKRILTASQRDELMSLLQRKIEAK